ncbi:hypothetical protein CL617_00045 [archaeon]|nr:hypothetical protein [archaeon]|tara:strand:- start:3394 stop:4758 length:1365 start_codon:yes stop_codon:yes gene_type:complete
MKYLHSYIRNNKISLFEIVFNNFKKSRVFLKKSFVTFLRNRSMEKFGSIYKLAKNLDMKTNKSYYSPIQRYLTSYKYRTSVPIHLLLKIVKLLDIPKSEIYNNIEYFQSWTGKKIYVPRYLKLDEDFIYGIGLYLGEGKNSDKMKQRIGIANSKKEIVKFSIYWFTKYFNINEKDLRFCTISPNSCNNEDLKINLKRDLKIKSNNFSMGNREKTNVSTIQVYYDSVIIRNLIDWLKENTIPLCLKDKKLGIRFLQGIMDGEGSVNISNIKRSVRLVLEMKNQFVLNVIEYILYSHGIDTNRPKSNKNLIYTQTRDYFKLNEIKPFRYNLKNKRKFSKGEKIIKRLQTFKGGLFYELLDYMEEHQERSFMLGELYNLIGRKGSANINFKEAINKSLNLGLIELNGKGRRRDPYEITITKDGVNHIKRLKMEKINHYALLNNSIHKIIQSRWKDGS